MDEETELPRALTVDELELALQVILSQALGESIVLTGWTLVLEAADTDMSRGLYPISPDGQPSWTTKGFLHGALDSLDEENLVDTVINTLAQGRRQEDDEEGE